MTADLRDEWIDQAIEAVGGEDTDFMVTAKPDDGRGFPYLLLSCRLCDWGEQVGQMELWELVTDARTHWATHRHDPECADPACKLCADPTGPSGSFRAHP